jgi:hypothetical protein
MFMTTKASTYQMYHSDTFDNPLSHSMFQNPLVAPHPDDQTGSFCILPSAFHHAPLVTAPSSARSAIFVETKVKEAQAP